MTESGDARWWLAAGVFAGLALLSKFTVVMLVPAVLAFMLVPDWRRRWLRSPYPWLAALIAVVVFLPVLIWNAEHDWASFRFQLVRATATHELSLRTVGEFIGLQFGLVGFVLLPVVLSGVALTAWRGYRRARAGRDPAVDRGDRAVRLFLLEIADAAGRRYLADVHVAGRLCRRRHQHRDAAAGRLAGLDDQIDGLLGAVRRSSPASPSSCWCFSITSPRPGISSASTDPIGGEAGYRAGRGRGREAELQKTGATWIATTDYRTYAMLRWFFNGRVPVIQINERGRFMGFRDPGMDQIEGHTGLYVAREPDNANPFWASTTAIASRWNGSSAVWRGVVMDTYALEKLTGWTPELSPPPDSPLFRWRVLAGDVSLAVRCSSTTALLRTRHVDGELLRLG